MPPRKTVKKRDAAPSEGDSVKREELGLLLKVEDVWEIKSELAEKTSRKMSPPLSHHIITTPPVDPPGRRANVKRDQRTVGRIAAGVNNVFDCPSEVLDSPAAKQPRGKGKGRRGIEGISRMRGRPMSKAISGPRVANDNILAIDIKNDISQNLKMESPSSGVESRKLHDTKISDYYPVRRSSRKTQAELKKEIDLNFQDCIESKQQHGLEVHEFVGKGRGIVTTRPFARNEFVVEYAGDLIDDAAAKMKESEYLAKGDGCYMYYFNHRNRNYCIDATTDSGRYGRLVNHSRTKPNCHTKIVEVKGQPHLVLLASRRIEAGEELLYDYGDRSKESLEAHSWLAF